MHTYTPARSYVLLYIILELLVLQLGLYTEVVSSGIWYQLPLTFHVEVYLDAPSNTVVQTYMFQSSKCQTMHPFL